MRKSTFTASLGMLGEKVVVGWQLACGAVVHRALLRDDTRSDWLWTVSDPVSGFAFVQGFGLGDAMARYRQLVRKYGAAWPKALADRRRRAANLAALCRRLDADRADLHRAPEMLQ